MDKKDIVGDEVLKKAELLMELRGYKMEDLHRDGEIIDINASKPDSDETVLIRVVTESEQRLDDVGVDKVRELERTLEKRDIDKIIMLGRSFTDSARRDLGQYGMEFFSDKRKIISALSREELYSKILDCVNELCKIECGSIPQSEDECQGYSEGSSVCSLCGGSGEISVPSGSYWKRMCPVCRGVGSKEKHYSCKIRLISDNVSFHFERGWTDLLQNDLLSLLRILRTTRRASKRKTSIIGSQFSC